MGNRKIQIVTIAAIATLAAAAWYAFAPGAVPGDPPQGDTGDSLVIAGPAAVFYGPKDEWIEEMKNTYGEEDFYVVADDAMYYQSQAQEFLESKDLKIIYTEARYLEFMKENGDEARIDRDKADHGGWGIYLFNGTDDPVDASAADIRTAYAAYFRTGE